MYNKYVHVHQKGRAHANTHSEDHRTRPPNDITARRNHRLEQEKRGRGLREGGVWGREEVQRPTYQRGSAYCLESTGGWSAGSSQRPSPDRCGRWWRSLNYHSVWAEGRREGGRQEEEERE